MNKIEALIDRHKFMLTLGAGVLLVGGYVMDGGLAKVFTATSMLLIVLTSTEMLNRKWVGRFSMGVLTLSLLPKVILLPGNILRMDMGAVLAAAILAVTVLRVIQVKRRHRRLRLSLQA